MDRPGVELAISQSQVRRPKHYATDPPRLDVYSCLLHVYCSLFMRRLRGNYGRLLVTLKLPLTAAADAATVLVVFNVSCRTPDQSDRRFHAVIFVV